MDFIISLLTDTWNYIRVNFMYQIPALVIAITIHEFFHAYTAMRLGDYTAKNQGRVTLNPIKHLDPIGTLLLFIAGFGWGKPVPVAVMNFRNPKRDNGLVSLAGPASNLGLAVLSSIFYGIFAAINTINPIVNYLFNFFYILTIFNITLAVLNLLPIYPLDGSKIFSLFLPDRTYFKILNYERYFFLILIILMFTGVLRGVIGSISQVFITIANFTTVQLGQLIGQIINSLFNL